jgi:hypothetical protein
MADAASAATTCTTSRRRQEDDPLTPCACASESCGHIGRTCICLVMTPRAYSNPIVLAGAHSGAPWTILLHMNTHTDAALEGARMCGFPRFV